MGFADFEEKARVYTALLLADRDEEATDFVREHQGDALFMDFVRTHNALVSGFAAGIAAQQAQPRHEARPAPGVYCRRHPSRILCCDACKAIWSACCGESPPPAHREEEPIQPQGAPAPARE